VPWPTSNLDRLASHGSTIAALSQQIGLLTNDAAVVAIMHSHGLTKIASNDPDFDRVAGLIRYAPA
jgi:predicted nucleic acid-binding protein